MRRSLFALLVALTSGCGDSLYLEGGVSQLCQRLSGQHFVVPRLPVALVVGTALPSPVTVQRTFDFDITAQLPPALQNTEIAIALDTMTLTPGQGLDLSFIDGAQVTLEPPPASTLPKQVVVRQVGTTNALSFDGQDLEVYPYLKDGVLSYTVALTASAMPPAEVSANISACANVSMRWDYAR